jgi:hypothetical protein
LSSDRRLYLVSSQPGAPATPARARRAHLRLVEPEPEAPSVPGADPPASALRFIAAPDHSLERPFSQRMMQVASDAAVFAIALLVGLRPNA